MDRGQKIERSHNQAKRRAGRWSKRQRTEDDVRTQKEWRRNYYKNVKPEQDPQSLFSRMLETVGLDDPYASNSKSYDYRAAKNAADPTNLAWMFPEVGDDTTSFVSDVPEAVAGGDKYDGYRQDEYDSNEYATREDWAYQQLSEWAEDFERINGRPPTNEEASEVISALDPRSRDEKNAATVMQFLNMPLFEGADETLAWTNSVINGTSYEDELAKAREIKERQEDWEDPFSSRSIAATVAGVPATFLAPLGAIGIAGRLGKTALGIGAPTSKIGRVAAKMAGGGAAGGGFFAAGDYLAGEGGTEKRIDNINPATTIGGAIGGGILGPALIGGIKAAGRGAKKAGAKGMSAGRAIIRGLQGSTSRAAGTSKSWRPTRETAQLRNQVKKNLSRSAKAAGSGLVGAAALGAAGKMLYDKKVERRW